MHACTIRYICISTISYNYTCKITYVYQYIYDYIQVYMYDYMYVYIHVCNMEFNKTWVSNCQQISGKNSERK